MSQLAATACPQQSFESGGWALVRRVRSGSVWHNAYDNLLGVESYGITASRPTADTSFSIPFRSWVSDSTEFLISSGMLTFPRSLSFVVMFPTPSSTIVLFCAHVYRTRLTWFLS